MAVFPRAYAHPDSRCDTGLVEFFYVPEFLRDEMQIPSNRLRYDGVDYRRVILQEADIDSMIEFVVKARGRQVLEQILGDPKLGPTVQMHAADANKAPSDNDRIIAIIDRLTQELS